jgi:hypothetical protein
VIIAQFGESANTLVKQWKGGYRNGFPTFRAAEPPVRPMHYDQSQIYSGVIGRQYEDSTNRYMYAYDPNMYLQPGFSGLSAQSPEQAAIAVLEGFLAFAPTGFDTFDVVFDTGSAGGVGISVTNRLMIIHGATLRAIQGATATAGGVFVTSKPDADLTKRIAAERDIEATIVDATIGKVDDVRNATANIIEALKSGKTKPLIPTPQPAVGSSSFTLSRNAKIAIGGVAGVLAVAGIAALVLRTRSRAPAYPAYDY